MPAAFFTTLVNESWTATKKVLIIRVVVQCSKPFRLGLQCNAQRLVLATYLTTGVSDCLFVYGERLTTNLAQPTLKSLKSDGLQRTTLGLRGTLPRAIVWLIRELLHGLIDRHGLIRLKKLLGLNGNGETVTT